MPSDLETTPPRRSVARFFVENRHVSWVLLVGVIAWGIWAYAAMPKRKDPDIPVRQVAVVTPWPGQSAERVEQLVTRKIEERVAQNVRVAEITSTTRLGLSVVYAEVDENARIDTGANRGRCRAGAFYRGCRDLQFRFTRSVVRA